MDSRRWVSATIASSCAAMRFWSVNDRHRQLQLREGSLNETVFCAVPVERYRRLREYLRRKKRIGKPRAICVGLGANQTDVPLEAEVTLLSHQNRDTERRTGDSVEHVANSRLLVRLQLLKILQGNRERITEVDLPRTLHDVCDRYEWNTCRRFWRRRVVPVCNLVGNVPNEVTPPLAQSE